MSIVEVQTHEIQSPDPAGRQVTEQQLLAQRELGKGVNWWALSLLDVDKDKRGRPALAGEVRAHMEAGRANRIYKNDRRLATWEKLKQQADQLAEEHSLEWWRNQARKDPDGEIAQRLRRAGLRSERAFVKIANIHDRGKVWELADFHVDVVRAMRRNDLSAVFMPLEHGKSALNSILVPLMDWAEWPEATECRVYWNQSHVVRWIGELMNHVEYNDELHKVYPWIRKPWPEDRSRHWSSEGFSIGGSMSPRRSFEVLTARGLSTGNRYSRTGCDDWVNSGNASSIAVQDGLEEYLLSGPITFGEYEHPESEYGTRWGTTFYDGTFFDRRDVGYRFYHWCVANGFAAVKFDVYPLGAGFPNVVLWQEGRPPEYIERKKRELRKMFNKRMRNIVVDEGLETFTADDVEYACEASRNAGGEWRYGKLPDGCHAMIGLDPAAGSKTRYAMDPALALWAEVPDVDDQGMETGSFTGHMVAWERLHGFDFTKQCDMAVEWARRYHLPLVIEKNILQGSYKSYITKMAPDVQVYDHQTGAEKWDPDDGVETFSPLFANHKLVIHADRAPEDELRALVTSLVEWPQTTYKDILMAFWFARSKMRRRQKINSKPRVLELPDYLRDVSSYWSVG